MREDRILCSEVECEPPYGGKVNCEFYEGGYCIGVAYPEEEGLEGMFSGLCKYDVTCIKHPKRLRNFTRELSVGKLEALH